MAGGGWEKEVNKETAGTQGSPDSEAAPAEPVRPAWVRGGSAGNRSPYFRAVPTKAADTVNLSWQGSERFAYTDQLRGSSRRCEKVQGLADTHKITGLQ